MFVERAELGETTSQERRDGKQPDSRVLGRVIHCDGARATLSAFACDDRAQVLGQWTVGRMISINLGSIRTVGLVYRIETPVPAWDEGGHNPISVHVELIGEVRDTETGGPTFDRGITAYPHVGAVAHRIRARDIEAVYDLAGRRGLTIGQLSQDESVAARIAIDDTLDRHFAVVGTTGVGKSTAVSLLVRKAVEARPDLRVLILDPHNEFSTAFPEQSIRINTQTLELPFWLFRLEELAEVLYRGREAVPEELDLLRDLIPLAKQNYRNSAGASVVRRSTDAAGVTADTPVPYRMADVVTLIDDRMGLLETKNDRPLYRALRIRIHSAMNDPSYRFMFAARLVDDSLHQTIGHIFRVPHQGRRITCLDLSVLPSEVVNSVCSVLARLAFDLALNSHGRLKLLVLCEEAHRYMPADIRLGFAPTRHALSRIAKEGRKYGCYLGVVTQRPGELDPTVLSQCSTIFAMRLANEVDQSIIRKAIADSSASTLSFLSSMGQREAIAFGEGVAATMRMKFEYLAPSQLPGSALKRLDETAPAPNGDIDIHTLVAGLRGTAQPAPETPGSLGVPVDPHRQAGDPPPLPPVPPEKRAPQPEERFARRFGGDDALRRLYE